MERPLVVAHRGLHDVRRAENSLGAIRAALAAGLTHIEVDVRGTGDGVLTLLHDAALDRTTSSAGLLVAHRSSDLGGVRLLDGSPLPVLSEVLALCRDRAVVCVDVKEPHLGPAVIAAADRIGATIEVWSNHREVIAHAADRGRPAAWISHGFFPAAGPEALVDEARQLGAFAISFFPADINERVVKACRAGAIGFQSGTPNDRRTWDALIAAGVRAIVTDRPLECLRRLLEVHADVESLSRGV